MALFKRDPKDSSVLPEIEKYYDAEKRERAGLAWLLAIASVAFVAALLIGVFFGGRWIYRKVTDTNTKSPVAVKPASDAAKTDTTTESSTTNSGSNANPSTNTPSASTPTPSTSTPTSTAQPSTATTPNSTVPTPTPTTTVTGAQSSTKLSNTGPESVIPVFIVTSVAGTILYRYKLKRSY